MEQNNNNAVQEDLETLFFFAFMIGTFHDNLVNKVPGTCNK